jgi:hypothetical protein
MFMFSDQAVEKAIGMMNSRDGNGAVEFVRNIRGQYGPLAASQVMHPWLEAKRQALWQKLHELRHMEERMRLDRESEVAIVEAGKLAAS